MHEMCCADPLLNRYDADITDPRGPKQAAGLPDPHLRLAPQRIQTLGLTARERLAPLANDALHGPETPLELGAGVPQRRLGIYAKMPREVHAGEQKVPELVLAGLRIARLHRLDELSHFLVELLQYAVPVLPVEAFAGGSPLQFFGTGESRQIGRHIVQRPEAGTCMAVFLLDALPALPDAGRVGDRTGRPDTGQGSIGKHVRMPAQELADNGIAHIIEVKITPLGGDCEGPPAPACAASAASPDASRRK